MTMRRIAGLFMLRVAPFFLAAALAGCSTTNLEDVMPVAALQPEQDAVAETAAAQDQPVFSQPGTYPNLNVVPTPAASQITSQQRRETTSELRARRAEVASQGDGGARDRSAELRRLARTHAEDVLAEIEGE